MVAQPNQRHGGSSSHRVRSSHDSKAADGARAHRARGSCVPRHHLDRLGFNWLVIKYLLGELPPLTMRSVTGGSGLDCWPRSRSCAGRA